RRAGARLSATDGDRVGPLRDDDVAFFGHHAHVPTPQMETNGLARARREVYALKPAQCPQGCAVNVGKFQIQLDDLITGHFASIGDAYRRIEGLARHERRLGQGQVAVFERRVAQSIPERPERLTREVAVSAPFHRVVLEI